MQLPASGTRKRDPIVAARCAFVGARKLLLSLLFALLTAAPGYAGGPGSIVFVVSGESPVYERVADTAVRSIFNRCGASSIDCDSFVFKQLTPDQIDAAEMQQTFLAISLGTKATKWMEQQSVGGNKIYAMLPLQEQGDSFANAHGAIAKIYIDQPYRRYFDLIKATIPRSGRVGLLIHESNIDQIEDLTRIAEQRGMTLVTSIVSGERDVGEALSYILDDIDVLLALPDFRIHNSRTISHILTTAYRNNIPVIGFSSAYVRAGATAAVYTSPDDIAHQVSDTVLEFLADGRVNRQLQQASYFSVSFNFDVARSLGLPLTPPSDIKKAIMQREEK